MTGQSVKDTMELRPLGTTSLQVSAMSVGSWLTLDHVEPEVGLEVLGTAIDLGVSFFDDARYDDRTGKAPIKTGYSEVVFGELFRKGGWDRDAMVMANKAWLEFYPDESIAEETEGSLSRLQMDCIDVMYTVPPPKGLPVGKIVEMMSALVASEKIRAWGGLNWTADQIRSAQRHAELKGHARFSAVQLPYNLLYRRAVESKAMRETCRELGVSVVASFGLGGGLLTNKYASGVGKDQDRLTQSQLAPYVERGALARVKAIAKVAEELELTPAQLALAYCLKGPNVASVVFGATTKEQVIENMGALAAQDKLDRNTLMALRGAIQKPT